MFVLHCLLGESSMLGSDSWLIKNSHNKQKTDDTQHQIKSLKHFLLQSNGNHVEYHSNIRFDHVSNHKEYLLGGHY